MRFSNLNIHAFRVAPFVLLVGLSLLYLAAALNGGTALAASDFDAVITYLKNNWLLSTFVISLSVVALLATAWQLMNGQGLGNASTIILILVVGVLGYSLIKTAATATHSLMDKSYQT
jgi:hypothetical protein